MAPANPVSARLLHDLGADTINTPSDLTLPQLDASRSAITVPIDFYVEAPDNIGGFIRYYASPELIRVAAPIYLKFGLRNSPDVYQRGQYLQSTVRAWRRARCRRDPTTLGVIRAQAPGASRPPLHSSGSSDRDAL